MASAVNRMVILFEYIDVLGFRDDGSLSQRRAAQELRVGATTVRRLLHEATDRAGAVPGHSMPSPRRVA